MTDYLTLGSTPCGESCAQMGSDDYHERMRKETKAYIHQLHRQFGETPGARLTTKSFPHDFGNYHEVCVVFNNEDEGAVEIAYKCEGELPESWDDEARVELGVEYFEALERVRRMTNDRR